MALKSARVSQLQSVNSMGTFKCPVCGHSISDYLSQDVKCPNCNSDLSIYRRLNIIAKEDAVFGQKNRTYKILAIALPVLVALLIGCAAYVFLKNKTKELNQQLEASNNTVVALRDSLCTLSTTNPVNEEDFPAYFEYVVLPNDSPWGIVHKFYGNRVNWQEASKKIAEDNGIWDDSAKAWNPIHPGDVLKLYNIE